MAVHWQPGRKGESAGDSAPRLTTLPGGAPQAESVLARRPFWPPFLVTLLGGWLAASPSAFAYTNRGLAWSDLITGLALILFGLTAFSKWHGYGRWASAAAGSWLLLAPLVFWAREPAAYLNDTVVGTLAILFSVILPGAPGEADSGPDTPPGWSYNPSAWYQRMPIVTVAFISFLVARHLAAFQLGHIPSVWEPFFGAGTRRVLESDVSRAFPVSDAGLGAVSYLVEALAGCIGGFRRWRTMPWMVMLFGILVVPLGVVSIVLIMLQPVAVGAWCTLCLVTAVLMLLMISPAMDEMLASAQFLLRARKEGTGFWRAFWGGGPSGEEGAVEGGIEKIGLRKVASAMDLTEIPWNLALCAGLGVWLMTAPSLLGDTGRFADSCYIVGPLVITASIIAIGQIARPTRLLNIPAGLWIVAAPFLLPGATPEGTWSSVLTGALLIALCLKRGRVSEQFGGWERNLV